jgi:hypothetical protein
VLMACLGTFQGRAGECRTVGSSTRVTSADHHLGRAELCVVLRPGGQ